MDVSYRESQEPSRAGVEELTVISRATYVASVLSQFCSQCALSDGSSSPTSIKDAMTGASSKARSSLT